MDELIGPHIHAYLHHPLLSSGEEMLNNTIAHLIHTGALAVDHSRVHLGHGEHHIVSRLFLSRAKDPAVLAGPEAYVLGIFPLDQPFSLADMRRMIGHAMPGPHHTHAFKTGPMKEHLLQMGLLTSDHMDSPEGRAAYRRVSHLLHAFEQDEDILLNDPGKLNARLKELGSNVVLLHWHLRDKLRELPGVDTMAKTVLVIQRFLESGGFYHERRMG